MKSKCYSGQGFAVCGQVFAEPLFSTNTIENFLVGASLTLSATSVDGQESVK